MALDPQLMVLISALGGTAVGSLGSLLITWINRRSEERKQIKQIIANFAIESYKADFEFAKLQNAKDKPAHIWSLDDHLIAAAKMTDLFLQDELTTKKAIEKIDQLYSLRKQVRDHKIKEYSKN
jgi:hypothetical protein